MLRKQIRVRGIVQGVGFRPFVYNLAQRLQLTGYVLNSSAGVLIEVEGDSAPIEQFLSELNQHAPPLAQIENIAIATLEPAGYVVFVIRQSVEEPGQLAPVSPDISTCADCLSDFQTPGNRRFGYAFTNCTNCGPRYTITRGIPCDRPLTTMACFPMCELCRREYEDPSDRRFHAQPNACPDCGPSLSLPLGEVRHQLHSGHIVAIKGLGGFHLVCDPSNDAAVRLLRERKRRSDKPFALMVPDAAAAGKLCFVSDAERAALTSVRRPIVILEKRVDAPLSPALAPGNNTLGVMLPYTPLHHLLFGDSFRALVMTSGNLSEEPIVTGNREAAQRLGSIADAFVFHNRDIHTRVDDSVTRVFAGAERVLRRSRGYAPHPLTLSFPVAEILACGAELKNTFCLTKDHHAFLSQHIGDLENYETLVFFRETLDRMQQLFRITPGVVAYDLHPGYLSTKLALEMTNLEQIGVQHHHAHIASCMAENGITGKVIGVAFDGTGFGTDGRIWGGEFVVADLAGFERRAHFRYVALAGADRAVREPWRLALSYLVDTFGAQLDLLDLPLWHRVPPKKISAVRSLIERRINTIETSACGRLFDAVASIVGLRDEVNFEAQAAIELEAEVLPAVDTGYPFEISADDPWQIDVRPMIEEIVQDVLRAKPIGWIAARFHNTIASIIVEVCLRLRSAEGIDRVCLSGGTFQNVYLVERAVRSLRAHGFVVFLHAKVPPNDGGVSLGQAVIANAVCKASAERLVQKG
ncbi:MAG: carbamoyltransferase HypF [Bryobacterales bacterium]|nr:carbamoyltransferase HypF [Bryobacterales bacterium]